MPLDDEVEEGVIIELADDNDEATELEDGDELMQITEGLEILVEAEVDELDDNAEVDAVLAEYSYLDTLRLVDTV